MLDIKEKEFVTKLRDTAAKYAAQGHELAKKDVLALNSYLDEGKVTPDFLTVLEENIQDIENSFSDPTSLGFKELMEGILDKVKGEVK